MKTVSTSLSLEMAQATEALGQNLAASEPFLRYRAAEQALADDESASSLLRELAQRQAEMRRRQSQGLLTASDLTRLRELQASVQENQPIIDYFRAQEQVTAYLQAINDEISNLIGIDFAGLARASGCC